MDVNALFGQFEVGEEKKTEPPVEAVDKMKSLEDAKQVEAKTRAANLLADLCSAVADGSQTEKRPSDGAGDGATSPKKGRLEEQKEGEDVVVLEGGDDDDDDDLPNVDAMPRMSIHTIETEGGCTHEVVVPPARDYEELTASSRPPARGFEFALDPFQKQALLCIDNYKSVLVSAHTSAGKTVVALYAIAVSLRDQQRVIYTSPIKALSNQKFRELTDDFGEEQVGLMTGDVTINPSASVLVMTTEILRSMLYRGSEIMREVGWVVFDEIHYMRDKERGVVWEETIILLPDSVHYVFLSATIPNARQFAEWVCFLHKQQCHVVYTDYRPVPLQHFIFPAGGSGLYEVVNTAGQFREDKFAEAMSHLKETGGAGSGMNQRGRRGGQKGESSVMKIIRTIKDKQMVPVICFSFSRKDCEGYATSMQDMDFNDDNDRGIVDEIFKNAIDVLSDDDKQLPQVSSLLPLLYRGIGIHHSGLLPILKEVIEILFAEGLIKALFATETFSMGLNMPARTVLFTTARKFDGKDFRWLTSGEYIQMSGRAGRRKLDNKGLVILMIDQQMGADVAKQIVKGDPDPLHSQFRLTYNMVLNLLRVEGINPEFMLERSFFQFQNCAALPELFAKVKELRVEAESVEVPREAEMAAYYQLERQIDSLRKELHSIVIKPTYALPFLVPGRMVHVKTLAHDFAWGVVVNYHKKSNLDNPLKNETYYIVDVLLNLARDSIRPPVNINAIRPCAQGERGQMEVVPVLLPLIYEISAARVAVPQDLRRLENRQSVQHSIEEVHRKMPDMLLIDPVRDMQIPESQLKDIVERLSIFEKRKHEHPLRSANEFAQLRAAYEKKLDAERDLKAAKEQLKKAKSLLQMDELKARKRVLRRLGYAEATDVITQKGRVACEISAADELLLTEMVFNGSFNALSVQQAAALLSTFVFQENAEAPKLSDELSGCLRQMQQLARHIAKATAESKLPIDEDGYVESFRPHLMDVVHAWCSGSSFVDIIKMTEIFEGSIIRALRRLEELMREMENAALSIGNNDLKAKFADGRHRIKRDIVFAASLYL